MYGISEKQARRVHELTAHRDNIAARFNRHAAGCARCSGSLLDDAMCNDGRLLKGEHETANGLLLDAQAEATGGVA